MPQLVSEGARHSFEHILKHTTVPFITRDLWTRSVDKNRPTTVSSLKYSHQTGIHKTTNGLVQFKV